MRKKGYVEGDHREFRTGCRRGNGEDGTQKEGGVEEEGTQKGAQTSRRRRGDAERERRRREFRIFSTCVFCLMCFWGVQSLVLSELSQDLC